MKQGIKGRIVASVVLVLCVTAIFLKCREGAETLEITSQETVDGYERLYVYSEEMKDTYAIDIVLPSDYTPDKKYPVLYLTDGNWRRENYKDLIKKDIILVGIGYPDDYDVDTIRFRDLIDFPEDFLQFIVKDVVPYVEKEYSVDTEDQTLWGASCGGYFALYALFQSDGMTKDVFKNYLIVSPAFMYQTDEKSIQMLENEYYSRTKELPANVYMAVGGDEESGFLDPFVPFANKLDKRGYEGLSVQYEVYPGLEHQTVWKPALMDLENEILSQR